MKQDKRLLVVDDEEEICNFVKMFFETRGIIVEQAHNGEEAIDIARSFQPQIILLDVNMGEGDDGLAVLPKILIAAPSANVLMTTGVDDEMMMAQAKELGAVDYITKPLILEDLVLNVTRQFNKIANA